MLDIGWTEMLVIAVVAIVVVGPKDLPRLLRTVGGYVTKVRRMAGDFQKQLNEAVRESELEDVRKEVQQIGAAGNQVAADVNKSMRIPPKPSGAPVKVISSATPAAVGAGAAAPAAALEPPSMAAVEAAVAEADRAPASTPAAANGAGAIAAEP